MVKYLSKILIILLIYILIASSIFPQQAVEDKELPYPYNPILDARKDLDSARYLAVNTELKSKEKAYLESKKANAYLQAMAISDSQIGEYQESISYFDRFLSQINNKFDPRKFNGYKPQDAVKVIESIATSRQIIFINELHHVPLHRAFTIRLLEVLYNKGFRYFCAETLSFSDKELNERKYPMFNKTGFYTDEPVYADLIRTALKLGYTVVPYDYQGDGTTLKDREYGQAKNLYDNILLKNPKAKILVHGGFGHIQKGGKGDAKLMGQYFKEISKIDPFSIDQCEMTEKATSELESKAYKYGLRQNSSNISVIFSNKKGKTFTNDSGYDAQIFHPHSEYQKGRPTWLLIDGRRKYYEIPTDLCKNVFPCLIQAFYSNESEDAVPIDQVKAISSNEIPALVLPTGDFRIRVVNSSGNVVNNSKISLK